MHSRFAASRFLRFHSFFALVVVCVLTFSSTAASATGLRLNGFSQATNDPDVQDLVDLSGSMGPLRGMATSSGASSAGAGTAIGNVVGSADYGVLRVTSAGQASGPFVGGAVAGGFLDASWTDDFTVVPVNPNLNFQQGTFVFNIQLSGNLQADAGGATQSNTRASYNLFVDAGTCIVGCDFSLSGESGDFGSLGGGKIFQGDPIGNFTSTPVPFVFGIPVDLSVSLSTTAQAVAGLDPFTSNAAANLSNTFVWGGFVEVRDMNGSLVTAYDVNSGSNVNWSLPVPEPGSAVLLLLGLAGLGARTTTRSRR